MADDDNPPLTVIDSKPLPALTVMDEPPPGGPTSTPVQEYWKLHPSQAQLVKGSLRALPLAGGLAGSTPGVLSLLATGGLSAPVSAAATVGGASLGAGAGTAAEDWLEEQLGFQKPRNTVGGLVSKTLHAGTNAGLAAIGPPTVRLGPRLYNDFPGTMADLIETLYHPQGTADKVSDYLRTINAPRVPSVNEGFTLPQATPMELPGGGFGVQSVNEGETLAPGTTVRVNPYQAAGREADATPPWIQKVPQPKAPPTPEADIRATQLYRGYGMDASAAAQKATGGDPSRIEAVMSWLMKTGALK